MLDSQSCGLSGIVLVSTDISKRKKFQQHFAAGTARYFCNAAVWLLGLEHRLEHNMPLKGPTISFSLPNVARTPSMEPKEDMSGRADIMLVIDGSSSVNPTQFSEMKHFSVEV
jgi:hypothetical protein